MFICIAASLENALNPVWASVTGYSDAILVTRVAIMLPIRFWGDICSICPRNLEPRTISAFCSMIGLIKSGICFWLYWKSPSVFTMISAPFSSAASRPVLNANARPRLVFRVMIQSAPAFFATVIVLSVEPSLITSTSTLLIPSIWRGISLITLSMVFSSLYAGMVMINFMFIL